MNWLTPRKKRVYWEWLDRLQFTNKNVMIVVNSLQSKQKYMDLFHLGNGDNIYYIPDIYDTTVQFKMPRGIPVEKRYVFTGGMANRDWGLLADIARMLPDIRFVCCCHEDDFTNKVRKIPNNMEIYYSLCTDEYYRLMDNAYLLLLPLITNRVSGLINITRAAQSGIPCVVSRYGFTEMYYPTELSEWLIDGNNVDNWVNIVKAMYELPEQQKYNNAVLFQDYIKNTFNPEVAYSVLEGMINTAKSR